MSSVPSEPPPSDGTRLGDELHALEKTDEKVRSAAWDLHRYGDRLVNPENYASINTDDECEAFNVRKGGMCKALLLPDTSCPYAHEHGDEFSGR